MSKQPEALLLANILEHQIPSIDCLEIAAKELRRLHEVNVELIEALAFARRELHACQAVMHLSGYGFDPAYVNGAQAALKSIDAAIAKAEEQA